MFITECNFSHFVFVSVNKYIGNRNEKNKCPSATETLPGITTSIMFCYFLLQKTDATYNTCGSMTFSTSCRHLLGLYLIKTQVITSASFNYYVKYVIIHGL